MHRIVVLVLVLAYGCIDESLVPCGDLACPQGDVCVASRCATPDQLSACAQLAEGADCSTGHAAGKCTGGICTPVVCGNGVLDPGEVCDDGNQVSGDGCNGTCTSNETCGNGVVDTAVGEGCDCGGASNPSALCAHPNSADPSAECGLDCKPRFCGDGIVNTIEQCDGSVPDDVTCASYGYYTGEVTCQACQLSPAQCSGRCGDGVIDSAHGEYCDQVVPSDGSCVAFGYDEGPFACGIGCGADLSGCHPLGWEHVNTPTASVGGLWGGAGRIAVEYTTGEAWVLDAGTWSKAPDTYSLVTGTATAVWAVGPDHVAKWTPAAGWQPITPPWPAATPLDSIWASDALGLFVSRSGTVALDHYDTAWTTIDGSWSAGSRLLATRTTLWLTPDFSHVYTFDGTTWRTISFGFLGAVAEDDQGRIWAETDQGIVRGQPGAWEAVDAPGDGALAPGLGTMMDAEINGAAGMHFDDLWVIGQPPLHFTGVPQSLENPLIAAAGSTIYAGGHDGLYELARGQWLLNGSYDFGAIVELDGGPVVDTEYGGAQYGGAQVLGDSDTFEPLTLPMDGCDTAGITSTGTLIAACGIEHVDGQTTVDAGGGLFEGGSLVVPGIATTLLWAASDASAAAASGPGVFAWRTQGTWQTITTTNQFTALEGDRIDELYAIDDRDLGLYVFDGVGWTLVTADAAQPLAVTPTRVYAGSSSGVIMLDRATGVITQAPLPANTYSFAGLGGEELFGVGNALPRGSPLWHFDGTTAWPVRMPPGVTNVIGVQRAGRSLLLVPDPGNPTTPPLWWLERTSAW